jgi:hypothetical protein
MVDFNVRIHHLRVRFQGIAPVIPQLDASPLAIGYLAATDGNKVVGVTERRALHSIVEQDPAPRVAGQFRSRELSESLDVEIVEGNASQVAGVRVRKLNTIAVRRGRISNRVVVAGDFEIGDVEIPGSPDRDPGAAPGPDDRGWNIRVTIVPNRDRISRRAAVVVKDQIARKAITALELKIVTGGKIWPAAIWPLTTAMLCQGSLRVPSPPEPVPPAT